MGKENKRKNDGDTGRDSERLHNSRHWEMENEIKRENQKEREMEKQSKSGGNRMIAPTSSLQVPA